MWDNITVRVVFTDGKLYREHLDVNRIAVCIYYIAKMMCTLLYR